MKKEYSKPLLYAERFELLEHIAGDCNGGAGAPTNAKDKYSCGMTDASGFTLFASKANCTSQYINPADMEALGFDSITDYIPTLSITCYTVFNSITNDHLFSS